MALAVYPPELRQLFQTDGFRTSLPDRRLTVQPARGRPWRRRSGSAIGGRPVSAVTVESIANLARFWRFFNEELDYGVRPFQILDQQIACHPLANQDGDILLDEDGRLLLMGSYWICLFDGIPEEARITRSHWQISFQLVVLQ